MKVSMVYTIIIACLLAPFILFGQTDKESNKFNVAVPTTQLSTPFCGMRLSLMNQVIYSDSISGAEDYEYRFSNVSLGLSTNIRRGQGTNDLSLNWMSGLLYGTTYSVQVRIKLHGKWENFGKLCELTTIPAVAVVPDSVIIPNTQTITNYTNKITSTRVSPVLQKTQLSSSSCGLTFDSLKVIHCDPIQGAQNYQYHFVNGLTGFNRIISRGQGTTDLDLTLVRGLQPDITYYVDVRANVDDIWASYGDVCTLRFVHLNNQAVFNDTATGSLTINMDVPLMNGETTIMSVYPNPVSNNEVFTVDMQNVQVAKSTIIYMMIYDSQSNVVMSQEFADAKRINFTIDERFKRGFYFVEMFMDDKRYCKRIIVQ